MSRENDLYTILHADSVLNLILTGGIYQSGLIGEDGITRDSTPSAFDGSGWLRPTALVKQRSNVPDGNVKVYDVQATSTNQVIEIYLYQDSPGYSSIDAAAARIYTLLQGHPLADTYEIYLTNHIDRQRDMGSLKGASLERMDFAVPSVMVPA